MIPVPMMNLNLELPVSLLWSEFIFDLMKIMANTNE
jgi:hypothetical protein